MQLKYTATFVRNIIKQVKREAKSLGISTNYFIILNI